jgi:hypothetical protein
LQSEANLQPVSAGPVSIEVSGGGAESIGGFESRGGAVSRPVSPVGEVSPPPPEVSSEASTPESLPFATSNPPEEHEATNAREATKPRISIA